MRHRAGTLRRRHGALRRAAYGVATTMAIVLPATTTFAGVGVAPVIIEFDDALRGGTYSKSLTLTNVDPDDPTRFTVTPQGDIASWMTVRDGDQPPTDTFIVPPETTVQLIVNLAVPAEAANRRYEGALEVLGEPEDTTEGAGVQLGGLVSVFADVTGTEHRSSKVVDYQVAPAEVGVEQRFTAVVQNDGNVQAVLQLDVTITRDDADVSALSTAGEAWVVNGGATDPVTVAWPTSEVAAGDYVADFTVTDTAGAAPVEIGSRQVAFRLEPRGTLTRSGELSDLKLATDPTLDGPTLIEATFTNTGGIETSAVVQGQLRREGTLVDTVESLARTIFEGESSAINVAVDLLEPGDYRFDAIVNYDGIESNSKFIEFEVDEDGQVVVAASGTDSSGVEAKRIAFGAGAAIAVAVPVAVAAVLVMRGRRQAGRAV